MPVPEAALAGGRPAEESATAAAGVPEAPHHPAPGELVYRFEGRLTELNPVGILPEGLLMANPFEATVTGGPLAGARLWGIDHFLVRPDGVGVIDAPETISRGDLHVVGQVRGYVLPPAGAPVPPLEAMIDPGFAWPDAPFRIAGSVMLRTADPDLDWLNRTVAVIAGEVNMSTGRLVIEARSAG
jgi:hypothetical protein